jgi:AcrR family transcriptional regulator
VSIATWQQTRDSGLRVPSIAVSETPIRDRKREETRGRIAEAALQLFVSHGYAETTIDQIAVAAGVGRRTIFRHFATKEAILFDHLVVRHELAVQYLRERPLGETALVSLHAVLRGLCKKGYDRQLLAQIRAVLATNPGLLGQELTLGVRAFERDLIATLANRMSPGQSLAETRALTLMALSWIDAAVRAYLLDKRPSLVKCFDEVVATCVEASVADLRRAPTPVRKGASLALS